MIGWSGVSLRRYSTMDQIDDEMHIVGSISSFIKWSSKGTYYSTERITSRGSTVSVFIHHVYGGPNIKYQNN